MTEIARWVHACAEPAERIKISKQIKIPARTLLLFGGGATPRGALASTSFRRPALHHKLFSLLLGAVACSPLRLYAPLAPPCFWIPLIPPFPPSSFFLLPLSQPYLNPPGSAQS